MKTLVVAHVYYPQLWPELAACVRNIDGGRDLVITYVDEATVQADIVQVFVRVLLGADPVVGKGQVLQSGTAQGHRAAAGGPKPDDEIETLFLHWPYFIK